MRKYHTVKKELLQDVFLILFSIKKGTLYKKSIRQSYFETSVQFIAQRPHNNYAGILI